MKGGGGVLKNDTDWLLPSFFPNSILSLTIHLFLLSGRTLHDFVAPLKWQLPVWLIGECDDSTLRYRWLGAQDRSVDAFRNSRKGTPKLGVVRFNVGARLSVNAVNDDPCSGNIDALSFSNSFEWVHGVVRKSRGGVSYYCFLIKFLWPNFKKVFWGGTWGAPHP